jgi:hypothetical protein
MDTKINPSAGEKDLLFFHKIQGNNLLLAKVTLVPLAVSKLLSILKRILTSNIWKWEWGIWEYFQPIHTCSQCWEYFQTQIFELGVFLWITKSFMTVGQILDPIWTLTSNPTYISGSKVLAPNVECTWTLVLGNQEMTSCQSKIPRLWITCTNTLQSHLGGDSFSNLLVILFFNIGNRYVET